MLEKKIAVEKKQGFSLAEAMITLVIVSIVIAASVPVISGRSGGNHNCLWKLASNDKDIYYDNTGLSSSNVGIGITNPAAPLHIRIPGAHTIKNPIILTNFNTSNRNEVFRIVADVNNLGIGNAVLVNNASGEKNCAFGNKALYKNEGSGQFEGNGNVAFGFEALKENIKGATNTAVGAQALVNNATGNDNVALGSTACLNVISTSNNICIGNAVQSPNPTKNDQINIGNIIKSSEYDRAYTGIAGIAIDSNHLLGYTNTNFPEEIGNTSPAIEITQGLKLTGGLVHTSDRRLKNVKSNYDGGLEKIEKLQPKYFTWKRDGKDAMLQVGVIAQDIQKIFPSAVFKDNKGYFLIRENEILYSAVNAIKELHSMLKNVINKISNINIMIENINTRVKNLEQENMQLKTQMRTVIQENKQLKIKIKNIEKNF